MPMTTISVIDETAAAVETLKFLADGSRLRILRILFRRESCVCELIEQVGLTQPLVSYHLRRLRQAGLVRTRRKAQWIYYSIDPDAWRSLVAPLIHHHLVTEFSAGGRLRCERQLRYPAPQRRPRRQRAERRGLARELTRSRPRSKRLDPLQTRDDHHHVASQPLNILTHRLICT